MFVTHNESQAFTLNAAQYGDMRKALLPAARLLLASATDFSSSLLKTNQNEALIQTVLRRFLACPLVSAIKFSRDLVSGELSHASADPSHLVHQGG